MKSEECERKGFAGAKGKRTGGAMQALADEARLSQTSVWREEKLRLVAEIENKMRRRGVYS